MMAGRRGGNSNPQPPVLETGALTKLSYTPSGRIFSVNNPVNARALGGIVRNTAV